MRRSIFAPLLGGAFAAVLALAACNKTYSSDEPFVDSPTPSLYIGSGNQFLYALTPDGGTRKWEFNTGGPIASTPFQDRSFLYVATTNGGLFKLDPNSGGMITDYSLQRGQRKLAGGFTGSIIGDNDFIYLGSTGNSLYAIDVKADTVEWEFPTGGPIHSSPMLYRDRLYFGSDDGSFYCLQKDGTLLWSYNPGTGGQFYASPTASGSVVYAASTDGSLYALNILTGAPLWNYTAGGSIYSSPLTIGGRIIFGANDGGLHCVDSASHLAVWRKFTKERIIASPYVYNQVVYVGSYDNTFNAYDIIDGRLKWSFTKPDKLFRGSPLAAGGLVYVGGFDQQLYALDTGSGAVRWQYDLNGVIETSPVLDNKTGTVLYPTISGASRY